MAEKYIRCLLERWGYKWGSWGKNRTVKHRKHSHSHWLGHLIWKDHQRIPQQAVYWEVLDFKRGPGQQRTSWRGIVKKDLWRTELTWEEVEAAAVSRHVWHWSVARCIHVDVGCIKVKVIVSWMNDKNGQMSVYLSKFARCCAVFKPDS